MALMRTALATRLGTEPADITSYFTAACGVADVDGVGELELLDEFGEVVGVGVEVVAGPRLAGTAMAAAVVGDATVAVVGEEVHLVFEGVGAKGPAVAEDDWLAGAPVFVVEVGAVGCAECAHLRRLHARGFCESETRWNVGWGMEEG